MSHHLAKAQANERQAAPEPAAITSGDRARDTAREAQS